MTNSFEEITRGGKVREHLINELSRQVPPGADGNVMDWTKSQPHPTFYVLIRNPNQVEEMALRQGELKADLADIGGIIWILLRVEGIDMEFPYNPSIIEPGDRPDISADTFFANSDQRLSFTLCGINTHDMTYFAIRHFSLSNRFSHQLAKLVQERAGAPHMSARENVARRETVFQTHDFKAILKKSIANSKAGA